VNSTRVLSVVTVVGLVLLVTVPLKLADLSTAKLSLSRNLHQAIVSMLASQGFDIKSGNIFGDFIVDARHNACHLQLREATASNVAAIKNASKGARLAFEYRGEILESHPTLRSIISENWNRLKWHFKIDNSWSPVVSVAAKGACEIGTLPWQRIATIRVD
jgi:hypothetical protein